MRWWAIQYVRAGGRRYRSRSACVHAAAQVSRVAAWCNTSPSTANKWLKFGDGNAVFSPLNFSYKCFPQSSPCSVNQTGADNRVWSLSVSTHIHKKTLMKTGKSNGLLNIALYSCIFNPFPGGETSSEDWFHFRPSGGELKVRIVRKRSRMWLKSSFLIGVGCFVWVFFFFGQVLQSF